MTTMELNSRKLEYVREFLNEENEMLIKEQIFSFWKAKSVIDVIHGLPGTLEELKTSVAQGMEDYRKGQVISHEDLEKEIATW
jgi:hypothetical protein